LFDLERDPGEACPMTMEGVGAEIPARLGAAMIDLFMDDLLG
jgi:hypothetical protein